MPEIASAGGVTVNHIASAFGGRFLTQDSGFGSFYLGFVAVWAVAVAISIGGLFIAMFQIPNKFFEKDGRVLDGSGKEWDPAWAHLLPA